MPTSAMPTSASRLLILLAIATALLAAACGTDSEPADGSDVSDGADPDVSEYRATIRWTSHGVPYIKADTLASAAFGQGYAFAKLNICTLADNIVRVRSERAMYLGPGEADANITEDFGNKALNLSRRADALEAELASTEEGLELLGGIEGYAAGYNAFLAQATAEGGPGLPERCDGEVWVKPISAHDLMTYYSDLALVAGLRNFKNFLHNAKPPEQTAVFDRSQLLPGLPDVRDLGIGSNGWAIGRDRSESGSGMILSNPHFPWEGELKWYESHLTVPGYLDVHGVSLYGVVLLNIGFNTEFAWTHTVSAARKFTIYQLHLVDGDPLKYHYGDEIRDLTAHEATIQVLQDDGTLEDVTRTHYRSHYGPIAVIPGAAEWTAETAMSVRDANWNNTQLVQHFFGVARSSSIDDLEAVFEGPQGNPWVTTIAADSAGEVHFSEPNSVPNLSDDTLERWQEALDAGGITSVAWQFIGAHLFDGSDPRNEWLDEPGAREPGLTPFSKTPQLRRTDYVFNANDSSWLTNDQELLLASNIFGDFETPRSWRTRMNAEMLIESGDGAASGDDHKFSIAELEAVVFNNRCGSPHWTLDEVLTRCESDEATADPDLSGPCATLAAWDGRYHRESVGAALWRQFWTRLDLSAESDWTTPFDITEPITTPTGIPAAAGPAPDVALTALRDAAADLAEMGFSHDSPLSDLQHTTKDGTRIALPGGRGFEGCYNVIQWSANRASDLFEREVDQGEDVQGSGLSTTGFAVNYGSSWIMALDLAGETPEARGILTYSQSSEPDSPYFKDQTELFAAGTLRDIPFTDAELEADAGLITEEVSAPIAAEGTPVDG